MTFFNSPLQRAPSRWRRYLAIALYAAIVAAPPAGLVGFLYWQGYFSQPATSAFEILRAPEYSVYNPPSGPKNPNDYWNNSPMRSNKEGLYNITFLRKVP